MKIRREVALVATLLAVIAAGAIAGWVGAVDDRTSGRRDEAAFREYVTTFYTGDAPQEVQWVREHPELVVEEGRQACKWLTTQPEPPDRNPTHTGPFSLSSLIDRYTSIPSAQAAILSDRGRSTITAGAWEFLCPAQRKQRSVPAPED